MHCKEWPSYSSLYPNHEMLHLFLIMLTFLLSVTTGEPSTTSISNDNWYPTISDKFVSNLPFFQLIKDDNLLRMPITSRPLDWYSMTTFTISEMSRNKAFLVYAGAVIDKTNTSKVRSHLLNFSSVQVCPLFLREDRTLAPADSECYELRRQVPGFLGASMKSIPFQKTVVLVTCDPHASSQHGASNEYPPGKCFVYQFKNNNRPSNLPDLNFCVVGSEGDNSTKELPCMGGYAIDLALNNDRVKLYVGLPFQQPFGRVSVVENLLSKKEPKISSVNYVGKFFHYGFALAGLRDTAYVSSPSSNEYSPNVTMLGQDKTAFTPPSADAFSSFGTVLEKVKLKGIGSGVLIGSPHTSSKIEVTNTYKPNSGRVYLACSDYPMTFVEGDQISQAYFGYSITSLGDIDGDGNDEFAVGAPFLREPLNSTQGSGVVYIYSIQTHCKINPKPIQILNMSNELSPSLLNDWKTNHFGYLIDGKSDLDFNGFPDLAVSGTSTKHLLIYRSRSHVNASCDFDQAREKESEPIRKYEILQLNFWITFTSVTSKKSIPPTSLSMYRRMQINPDSTRSLGTKSRFLVSYEKRTLQESDNIMHWIVHLNATMDAEDMNLHRGPVLLTLRDVLVCQNSDCLFPDAEPIIHWDKCRHELKLKANHCIKDECVTDISMDVNDTTGGQLIEYGNTKIDEREIYIVLKSPGESINVVLNITFHGAFRYLGIEQLSESKVDFSDFSEKHVTIRILDRYLKNDVDLRLAAFFNFSDVFGFGNASIEYVVNSTNMDPQLDNNVILHKYRVIYQPKIEIHTREVTDVIDNRTQATRMAHHNRYNVDDIGPQLTHPYTIINKGNMTVRNVTLFLRVPFSTSKGQHLIYLYTQERVYQAGASGPKVHDVTPVLTTANGLERGNCTIPEKFHNPLNIIPVRSIKDNRGWRLRRSAKYEDSLDINESQTMSAATGLVTPTRGGMKAPEIIKCDTALGGRFKTPPECGEIVCHLDQLLPREIVRLEFKARILAATFFQEGISSVTVFTSLRTTMGTTPEGVEIIGPSNGEFGPFSVSQNFYFERVKEKSLSYIPIWPIILGVILGILLLTVLIVALYQCGFFQRKRRERMAEERAQKREVQNNSRGPRIVHSTADDVTQRDSSVPMYQPPQEDESLLDAKTATGSQSKPKR